jgi:hypothetical protein
MAVGERRATLAVRRLHVHDEFPRGAVLALLAVIALTSPVSANGPEVIATGASLVPVQSSAVQLVREIVHVTLPGSWDQGGGNVDCRYWLRNETPTPATIQMAFVTGEKRPTFPDVVETFRDSRFSVRMAGQDVPVTMKAILTEDWSSVMDAPPDSLPVWEITIAANETAFVVIKYDVWWSGRIADSGDRDVPFFRYNARPAALWAGPIEECDIVFSIDGINTGLLRCLLEDGHCAKAVIDPPGYDWRFDGIHWHFQHWEPDRDFDISLDMPMESGK